MQGASQRVSQPASQGTCRVPASSLQPPATPPLCLAPCRSPSGAPCLPFILQTLLEVCGALEVCDALEVYV